MSTKVESSSERNWFTDKETLKKGEWNRRRLLRLEQVRQQSKDIASLVRHKVQIERDKQLGLVRQRVEAKNQRKQVRKLRALQTEYANTFQNIGKSHAEAARQPNEEMARAEQMACILDAAQRRGQEALACLKEEEAARRKADEERRTLQQNVRALEDSRSAAIVTLPLPETTVRPKSPPPRKTISISAPSSKVIRSGCNVTDGKGDIPAWPKKSWSQSVLPLGVTLRAEEQGDVQVVNDSNVAAGDTVPDQISSVKLLPSESCPRIQDDEQMESPVPEISSKVHKICNTSKSSVAPSEVKLYDHRNLYEKQYSEPQGLVEKIQTYSENNARQTAEKENYNCTLHEKSLLARAHREHERSKQALHKIHVQHNYKQLMTSLSILAKQKAAICGLRGPSAAVESSDQDRRIVVAVEELLQRGNTEFDNSASDSILETPDGTLLVSNVDGTPGSVPKLNVGRANIFEPTSPTTCASVQSNVVPSATVSHAAVATHSDTSLTTLLQRINQERNQLLHNNQELQTKPILEGESLEHWNQQEEVKLLERKVKQQRQQLRQQHSEVQRLDASIKMPECGEVILGDIREQSDIYSRSVSHESINVEASVCENSEDSISSSSHNSQDFSSFERSNNKKIDQSREREKKSSKERRENISIPSTKNNVSYNMDVSLSSIIMDHSTSSTSGSQSVSLHGVQVLVKVSGADESSPTSSSEPHLDKRMPSVSLKNGNSPENVEADVPQKLEKQSKKHTYPERNLQSRETRSQKSRRGEVDPLSGAHTTMSSSKAVTSTVEKNSRKFSKAKKDSKQRVQNNVVFKDKKSSEYGSNAATSQASRIHKKGNIKTVVESEPKEELTSTSTSYFSPPELVLSSLTKDIQALLAMAQNNTPIRRPVFQKKGRKFYQNPLLMKYISRLLTMSRESIEKLHVDCSEVSTPSSDIFHSSEVESGADVSDGKQACGESLITQEVPEPEVKDVEAPAHQSINDSTIHLDGKSEDWFLNSERTDKNTLSDLTKQCHDKITALTKTIEKVREQETYDHHDFDAGLLENSLPMDSTAYMSPPPQVLEWDDVLPNQNLNDMGKDSSDPYTSAVLKLLADVHAEMASQNHVPYDIQAVVSSPQEDYGEKHQRHGETAPPRPRPPVAFWRNLNRCNMTSPMDPHELSTIPELGATLPDSTGSAASDNGSVGPSISPPTNPGTPPDVIAELLRRNILTSPFSWAKELGKENIRNQHVLLSFNSSSDTSPKNSKESELSSAHSGIGKSDISASKETNSLSLKSNFSNSGSSSDWKTNIILSPVDFNSSTDEVEGDFRRLGIGWVGAMLRKTKEAGALCSTSSSEGVSVEVVTNAPLENTNELKDISDILDHNLDLSGSVATPMYQGRGHSTPVKQSDSSNSPGPSSGVV